MAKVLLDGGVVHPRAEYRLREMLKTFPKPPESVQGNAQAVAAHNGALLAFTAIVLVETCHAPDGRVSVLGIEFASQLASAQLLEQMRTLCDHIARKVEA